jgi:hypothetical protein
MSAVRNCRSEEIKAVISNFYKTFSDSDKDRKKLYNEIIPKNIENLFKKQFDEDTAKEISNCFKDVLRQRLMPFIYDHEYEHYMYNIMSKSFSYIFIYYGKILGILQERESDDISKKHIKIICSFCLKYMFDHFYEFLKSYSFFNIKIYKKDNYAMLIFLCIIKSNYSSKNFHTLITYKLEEENKLFLKNKIYELIKRCEKIIINKELEYNEINESKTLQILKELII